MFLKNVISVMMCGLLLCLVVMKCERNLSTDIQSDKEKSDSEPHIFECEDDGIMKLVFAEYSYEKEEDGNGILSKQVVVDSIFLSETAHELIIENAIPFTAMPDQHLFIFFRGHFDGMPDAVYVWWKNSAERYGLQVNETIASRLKHNLGTALVASTRSTLEPVQGFIFCMDSDLDNSGTGVVEIHHGSRIDTVQVDAAKNTVLLPPVLRTIDFDFADAYEEYRLDILITPEDRFCTFTSTQDHGVLIFKELTNPKKQPRMEATSLLNGYIPSSKRLSLEIIGFVPKFKIKEIQNE